jgi:hypothetical protein
MKKYQTLHLRLVLKTVTIPACDNHEGIMSKNVILKWECPVCGMPRGKPAEGRSYDGSRILYCHTWINPCGHIDKYAAVREEAKNNPYN